MHVSRTTSRVRALLAAASALLPLASAQAAQQIAPVGAVATSSPRFEWTADPGAIEYEIAIYRPADSTTRTLWHSRHAPIAVCRRGVCATTLRLSLENGAYEWIVRSRGIAGPRAWTPRRAFDVATDGASVAVPSTLWPSGDGIAHRPVYVWSAVAGAAVYEIEVDGGDVNMFLDARLCGSGVCFIWGDKDLYDGAHAWHVRARAANGALGAWSPVATFAVAGSPLGAVPAAPTAIAPVGGATTSALPTFRWTPVAGTLNYSIRVFHGAETIPRVTLSTMAGNVCHLGRCVFTPVDRIPVRPGDTGAYRWSVRAIENNAGPSSAPAEFNIR